MLPILLPALLLAALALPAADTLKNPGFEDKPTKTDPVPGWTVVIGALNGANEPESVCEVDRKEQQGGKSALHFHGENPTRAWKAAEQPVEARPGGRYRLTGQYRASGVRREGIQFNNCYVALFLFDASGELLAREFRTPGKQDAWQDFTVELTAPDTVREAKVFCFLSMTGDLWIDDLALTIEGGTPLPPTETLLAEDFEQAKDVPEGWTRGVGAINAGGGKESQVTVDGKSGAGGSKRSLRFKGDGATRTWFDLSREFPCSPGDLLTFSARARGEDVHQEGIQFANLHARLLFRDAAGETLGSALFEHPGTDSFDWKDVRVRGVAPPGAARCMVGLFLSMSGEAWWDDLRVTRQPGNRPAYDGWLTLETQRLRLRYPVDHPRAAEMVDFGARLDAEFDRVCAALGVTYDERVVAWLYRDAEQGRRLTGRELAWADPEGRAFHQGPANSLAHELTHVLALKLGYAQTAVLGEGLAVWLDGNGDAFHHDRARELLRKGELPAVAALFERFREEPAGYPAAGSLCGWLIGRHGMQRFAELYRSTDPRALAPQVLQEDFTALEQAWRDWLAQG